MATFADAMLAPSKYTLTENGALSLDTTQPDDMKESIHGRMAFFFKSVRSLLTDLPQLYKYLELADAENTRDTLILCFYMRNCRKSSGGKGERDLFRHCVQWYVDHGKSHLIEKNLDSVVKFGRWDDVLICPGGYLFMARQLLADYQRVKEWEAKKDENANRPAITLAAKWAPSASTRNKKSKDKHLPVLNAIQTLLRESSELSSSLGLLYNQPYNFQERDYRHMLSCLRRHLVVIECLMCDNQWDKIDFNHVPSNAMSLYGKKTITGRKVNQHRKRRRHVTPSTSKPGAFMRHCEERFTNWRDALKTGKTVDGKVAKVNASQLFPHEVVSNYLHSSNAVEDPLIEAQWSVLEKQVKEKGSMKSCLFVADVSGSMTEVCSPGSSVQCLDVSIALSLLGARCCEGKFKNLVVTFDNTPKFFDLSTGKYSTVDESLSPEQSDCCFDTILHPTVSRGGSRGGCGRRGLRGGCGRRGLRGGHGQNATTIRSCVNSGKFSVLDTGSDDDVIDDGDNETEEVDDETEEVETKDNPQASTTLNPQSLLVAVERLRSMEWGGSTNLQGVFDMVLERAKRVKLDQSEMPKCIVIVSDMEFNQCDSRQTNFETIKSKFQLFGYKMPTLVFWNVRSSSSTQQFPVSATEDGVILLSGFSAAIMQELLTDGLTNINPWKIVRRIIDSDVYKNIVV